MGKRLTTTRDLELRVVALEAAQEQILSSLARIERDTSTLKGYVQNVRGGWKVLAVLGGVLVAVAGIAGAVLKLVRGGV